MHARAVERYEGTFQSCPFLYDSMSAICCISAGKFPAHTLKVWSFLPSAGNIIPTFPFYFHSFPPFLFFSPRLSILPSLSFIFAFFFSSLYSLPPFLVAVWLTLDNFVVCSEWKVCRLIGYHFLLAFSLCVQLSFNIVSGIIHILPNAFVTCSSYEWYKNTNNDVWCLPFSYFCPFLFLLRN